MPKQEPGVYEPTSEDIRVFDAGDDDYDEEGSRLPLLIVIALLVLAAFGGVVWLAYTQGVQRGREGPPRIITAENGPVRTAPENPGGKTPYEGLKIYEQPAPPEEESTPAESTPPPAQAAETPKPVPQPMTKAETPKPATQPVTKAEAPKPAPQQTAKAETPKPAPVESTTPASAPAASGGAYVAQIGAYKSDAEAMAAWQSYQRRHPMVGGYSPDVKRVDLGDKGVWYRLRIGSFANREDAGALCEKLQADGGACFPAKN